MEDLVRLSQIHIINFKNVDDGLLSFDDVKNHDVNILGLYGQNGSGKTALIEAIFVLKCALSNVPIPPVYAELINVEAPYSQFIFSLSVCNKENEARLNVVYDFKIRKDPDEHVGMLADGIDITQTKSKVTLFDEVLSYSFETPDLKERMSPVIDTTVGSVFGPKTKYDALIGLDKNTVIDLLAAKAIAKEGSRSFIFSKALSDAVHAHCRQNLRIALLNQLSRFGREELFVVGTNSSGLISLNMLPFFFYYMEGGRRVFGAITLPADKPAFVSQDVMLAVSHVINDINIVLTAIVPGLSIGLQDLGSQLGKDGRQGKSIQLISIRGTRRIPLCHESEGVKKIVSILHLLICVYNRASVTVAIDELDSGIFEYLLGELLHIIEQGGCGQLIFTSHNLRPLETIDKRSIAFTSTDPKDRYVRLSNLKTTNNLRDVYYRDILLGGSDAPVYDRTSNVDIELAFRKAWHPDVA